MHRTILHMLSTNSLSAFSSASTTSPVHQSTSARLVRDVQPLTQPNATKNAIPSTQPSIAPPRGSLLNLSV